MRKDCPMNISANCEASRSMRWWLIVCWLRFLDIHHTERYKFRYCVTKAMMNIKNEYNSI